MPEICGVLISHKMATLRELQEYYSFEDALDMYEIILVDAWNEMKSREDRNG